MAENVYKSIYAGEQVDAILGYVNNTIKTQIPKINQDINEINQDINEMSDDIKKNNISITQFDNIKGYVPQDTSPDGRTIILTSIEGLEAGGLLSRYIVDETTGEAYWQSRTLEAVGGYDPGVKLDLTEENFMRPKSTWEYYLTKDVGFPVKDASKYEVGDKVYIEGYIKDEYYTPIEVGDGVYFQEMLKAFLLGTITNITASGTVEFKSPSTRILLTDTNKYSIKDWNPKDYPNWVLLKNAGFSTTGNLPLTSDSTIADGILIYEDGSVGTVGLEDKNFDCDLSIVKAIDLGAFNKVGLGAIVSGIHNKSTGVLSDTGGSHHETTGFAAHNRGSANKVSGKYSGADGTQINVSGDVARGRGILINVEADYGDGEGYDVHIFKGSRGGRGRGRGIRVASPWQIVDGTYNIIDKDGKYIYIFGNGTDDNNRSNAYTLDWDGNAEFSGDVKFCDPGGAIYSSLETANRLETEILVRENEKKDMDIIIGALMGEIDKTNSELTNSVNDINNEINRQNDAIGNIEEECAQMSGQIADANDAIESLKENITLIDQVTGKPYNLYVSNGQLVINAAEVSE